VSDLRISRASASKSRRGRPLGRKTLAIRDAVLELTAEYDVMTVRQVFYALTVRGVVPKTENGGYRPVQTQVLKMRREGLLPWHFIADATRWQRKPQTWDSVDDALRDAQRTYRRNLWRSQGIRLEVWLEKDALASIVSDVTGRWDVPLMVSRGTSSATFLYEAAQAARSAWVEGYVATRVLALYDHDAAGARCFRTVEDGLRTYSGLGSLSWPQAELIAVTEEQISEWNLPTRPAKATDPEAHKFKGDAVELDAIPPDKLTDLVESAIIDLVDADAWEKEQAVEESERDLLGRIVGGAA